MISAKNGHINENSPGTREEFQGRSKPFCRAEPISAGCAPQALSLHLSIPRGTERGVRKPKLSRKPARGLQTSFGDRRDRVHEDAQFSLFRIARCWSGIDSLKKPSSRGEPRRFPDRVSRRIRIVQRILNKKTTYPPPICDSQWRSRARTNGWLPQVLETRRVGCLI